VGPDQTVIRTVEPPRKYRYEFLYGKQPAADKELLASLDQPWKKPDPLPADAAVLPVARVALDHRSQTEFGNEGPTYPGLARAVEKAGPPGAVVEVRDNGPLFETGFTAAGKHLVVRAAPGYRPLVVWDLARALAETRNPKPDIAFLSCEGGSLTLEGVDVVLLCPASLPENAVLTFLQARQADVTVRNCTFSVANKGKAGVTLVQMAGPVERGGVVPVVHEPTRCRVSTTYARGNTLTALDLRTPGDVLVEDSLVAGGEPALVKVKATDEQGVTLRVVRSTLVCGKDFLTVEPLRPIDRKPWCRWVGVDSLLSRSRVEAEGSLVVLPGEAAPVNMQWQSVNCLYAGWVNLFRGRETVPVSDDQGWARLWGRPAERGGAPPGDLARRDIWPAPPYHDLEDKPAVAFSIEGVKDLCFARSDNRDKTLGCDLERLPPARDNWKALTGEEFIVRELATPTADDPPPEIPKATGDRYAGERFELSGTRTIDLGKLLLGLQEQKKLADKVVIRVAGTGTHRLTPFKLKKGTNLTLFVEPPEEPKADPLSPTGVAQPPREKPRPIVFELAEDLAETAPGGVIELEGGSLELSNVDLRLPDNQFKVGVPKWVVKANGGVRLFRCRLQGPLFKVPPGFRGALSVSGSGEEARDRQHDCAIAESVFLSGKEGIHCEGVGLRVQLGQSLVVALGQALVLDPGEGYKGRANLHAVLEHSTLVGRQAAVALADPKFAGPPAEPIILQTQACAFLNPFHGRPRSGLLLARGTALARGLLVWQGKGDALDPRLFFVAASDAALPEQPQAPTAWLTFWGQKKESEKPVLDLVPKGVLDQPGKNAPPTAPPAERWSLERLTVPFAKGPATAINKNVGADLDRLGLLRSIHR
jgi:hypothetical protein